MTTRRPRPDALAATALVALAAVLWVPRLAGPLDLRYDAGVYYILGLSLADGSGYRLLNEPGEIQAIQYPPLLPALIAAHVRLTGSRDPAVAGHALRWTFAALFLAYVLVTHRVSRQHLGPGWAFVTTLMVLLHLQATWLSDLAFAELPFALCTMLFVLVAPAPGRRAGAWLLAGAAALVRSTGLAALAAWSAEPLLHRRFREAMIRIVLAIAPLLAWQLYIGSVQRSAEFRHPAYTYQRAPYQYYNVGYLANMAYTDPFVPERGLATGRELAARVRDNVLGLPRALGESVSGARHWVRVTFDRVPSLAAVPTWAITVPFVLLGLASIAGHGVLAARGTLLVPLYWTGSLLLIALTPWPAQFGRYLMPLTPLTAIGLATLLANMTARLRMLRPLVVAGLAGIVVFQMLILTVVFTQQHPVVLAGTHRLFFYDEPWRAHDAAVAWLGAHAAQDAVVATSTPHVVYLATGRRAVFPPFEPEVATAAGLLDAVPVTYVLVDDLAFVDLSRRYGDPVVTRFPDRWELVYGTATSGSRIYRRR